MNLYKKKLAEFIATYCANELECSMTLDSNTVINAIDEFELTSKVNGGRHNIGGKDFEVVIIEKSYHKA